MMTIIKVGCCGWAIKGGMKSYFKEFNLIELQSTFYKLPKISTVQRWIKEAPEGFEFTVKAWQVITHPPTSPTWRRAGIVIDARKRERYGFFRPTEENFEAWERTLEICRVLKAKVCLFQTPASFKPTSENIGNIKNFFSSIDRGGLLLAWEPRGLWNKQLKLVGKLCDELGLIHVVDIFKRWPHSHHEVAYIRLHGLGREINYKYKYTDEDLRELVVKVKELTKEKRRIYVLFNNVYMGMDAKRFIHLIRKVMGEEHERNEARSARIISTGR